MHLFLPYAHKKITCNEKVDLLLHFELYFTHARFTYGATHTHTHTRARTPLKGFLGEGRRTCEETLSQDALGQRALCSLTQCVLQDMRR